MAEGLWSDQAVWVEMVRREGRRTALTELWFATPVWQHNGPWFELKIGWR